MAQLERMGKKSAENLMAAIQRSKEQDLSRLIYAFGIRQVGAEGGQGPGGPLWDPGGPG